MPDLILTYPTADGSGEMPLNDGRVSFGRGSDADIRVADESLSRLHATIYREGDRIWIVDENSSNGSFVNGSPVGPSGTPLRAGDEILLGNSTKISLRIAEEEKTEEAVAASAFAAPAAEGGSQGISIIPVALIALAFMIMSVSVAAIGYKLLVPPTERASGSNTQNDDSDDDDLYEKKSSGSRSTPTPETSKSPTPSPTTQTDDNTPLPTETPGQPQVPSGKKYMDMSPAEKQAYVAERSMRIAQVIGNRSSDHIPPDAVSKIKADIDAYATRLRVKPLGGSCRMGDNLQVTYERASKNAPFIIRAFNAKGIDSRIGLYLAMIESEHCVCLQSRTGPLGMFQFTKSTGEIHGLRTVSGATPANPDERCEPEPSARAAASYMKALTGRYGTGPASVPLAIGSYNSGEGGLSSNLVKALESNSELPRDFWSLVVKSEILSHQFQAENFRYVPKFFASAIIGENPEDFGLKLHPLSSYSK
ncbi:MAG: FHA domain-containing protein [Acidobacteria bacterium]|nr:FHA domain-containing protein [Acidobacteriota bacterium]